VDIGWFKPDGEAMTDQDWEAGHARSLGVFLNGNGIQTHDDRGRMITDDSFVLLFNAHYEAVDWVIPRDFGGPWRLVLDTAREDPEAPGAQVGDTVTTMDRSMVVLEQA
jgi:glycogen operon protein